MRRRFTPRPVFKLVCPRNDWRCKKCEKVVKGRHQRDRDKGELCAFRNLFMTGAPPERYCVPCAEELGLTIVKPEEATA